MTPEQREQLREAVADEVMGWHKAAIPWAYEGDTVCWLDAQDAAIITCHAWHPDEDDTQNMQVLDRMIELGFECSLELDGEQAFAAFGRDSVDGTPVAHPERRLVVLLAALAAVQASGRA